MKLNFPKSLRSKIKKLSIEDILQILLVTTAVLIVITIINPRFTAPLYGINPAPLTAYFDVFVRYGTFIFIYFTLIPILILWLAKRRLKEKWNPRSGFLSLVASLFVLTTIFFVVPGPIYENPFNVPWFETPDTGEKFKQMYETAHEFCENRVDVFYKPTSPCSVEDLKPTLETIKDELESKGSDVKVYIWCAGENETSCEEYKRGEYTQEDVKNLSEEYGLKTLPTVVVGCKYNMRGIFGAEDYKQIICEKFNECDL
jgi:hypothetical protein